VPDDCLMCRWVAACAEGTYPYLVADLGTSVLVMGDDRDGDLYRGYAILAFKEHVREPHELPDEVAASHMAELVVAGRAIDEAFSPVKVNYASFGNEVPHLHWHIIPRYAHDPDRGYQPWRNEGRFVDGMITPQDGAQLAATVRRFLPSRPAADATALVGEVAR
jgi:diadenosine tetraphosphate (Ap4A) HIT family hydrolase